MPRKLRVVCLQTDASRNFQKNLSRVQRLLLRAVRKNPDLIALPENFYWRGSSEEFEAAVSGMPEMIRDFRRFARCHRVALLLGSVAEKVPGTKKYYNTSLLISDRGKITARYRKIHLFDIGLSKLSYRESRLTKSGNHPVLGRIKGVSCGLSICYDLRFPELYRNLVSRGARIFFVPANFTEKTGKAHWEVLLRARAIENQAFVIAPAQSGSNESSGLKSFGTSMILDPWGKVLARAKKTGEEILTADLDLRAQEYLRRQFPVLTHRKKSLF